MRLGYIILYVADVAKTVAFYERAFGLERRFVHESGTYAEMETGATAFAFAEEAVVAAQGQRFQPCRLDSEPPAEARKRAPVRRAPGAPPARPPSRTVRSSA